MKTQYFREIKHTQYLNMNKVQAEYEILKLNN